MNLDPPAPDQRPPTPPAVAPDAVPPPPGPEPALPATLRAARALMYAAAVLPLAVAIVGFALFPNDPLTIWLVISAPFAGIAPFIVAVTLPGWTRRNYPVLMTALLLGLFTGGGGYLVVLAGIATLILLFTPSARVHFDRRRRHEQEILRREHDAALADPSRPPLGRDDPADPGSAREPDRPATVRIARVLMGLAALGPFLLGVVIVVVLYQGPVYEESPGQVDDVVGTIIAHGLFLAIIPTIVASTMARWTRRNVAGTIWSIILGLIQVSQTGMLGGEPLQGIMTMALASAALLLIATPSAHAYFYQRARFTALLVHRSQALTRRAAPPDEPG
ncbi:hypothetical protein [Allonocardiopsis opalescens]|uniref:Uncharacterized protein n=1 Tax=Allonocardiopsis opalescens TaxID=1144618 RepID=A0A2T0PTQ8_9ACTN|nr:hypothetical protein [Allonocardiopsis opalescens]PRX92283.1 hypothetical protein CLV72_11043 [Allonocardiopsis opalescens]